MQGQCCQATQKEPPSGVWIYFEDLDSWACQFQILFPPGTYSIGSESLSAKRGALLEEEFCLNTFSAEYISLESGWKLRWIGLSKQETFFFIVGDASILLCCSCCFDQHNCGSILFVTNKRYQCRLQCVHPCWGWPWPGSSVWQNLCLTVLIEWKLCLHMVPILQLKYEAGTTILFGERWWGNECLLLWQFHRWNCEKKTVWGHTILVVCFCVWHVLLPEHEISHNETKGKNTEIV